MDKRTQETIIKDQAAEIEQLKAQNVAMNTFLEEINLVVQAEWLDRMSTRHIRTLAQQALSAYKQAIEESK